MSTYRWNDDWLIAHCGSMEGDPDLWPYSEQFEELAGLYREETGHGASDRAIWRRCVKLRKDRYRTEDPEKRMPRFTKGDPAPSSFRERELVVLRQLYDGQSYPLERLGYMKDFDELCAAFLKRIGRGADDCSKGEVWRALVTERKGGRLQNKVKVSKQQFYGEGFGL